MSALLPFTNLSASSNGEIYDITDAKKFVEFGWRCSTNESGFKSETLIGNWNEERYDIKYLAKKKPIPSQYNHYFETTHRKSYSTKKNIQNLPDHVKLLGGSQCEPRTFPSHQPELDPPSFKHHYNEFVSTSMAAYKDHRKK
ncbi:cilia- and flagella-associated protein 68-like [Clytia hemisphaerica]|uniref:cilia- and flagella-associated protein 68-like n=1 Tax=Clytia hemisphaerica TaxID=252671 RepID=UPI0034D49C1E